MRRVLLAAGCKDTGLEVCRGQHHTVYRGWQMGKEGNTLNATLRSLGFVLLAICRFLLLSSGHLLSI